VGTSQPRALDVVSKLGVGRAQARVRADTLTGGHAKQNVLIVDHSMEMERVELLVAPVRSSYSLRDPKNIKTPSSLTCAWTEKGTGCRYDNCQTYLQGM